MRLADLDLVLDLAGELKRLDEIAGPAELQVHDGVLMLSAEETADFVEWKRQRVHARLRALGVDVDGRVKAAHDEVRLEATAERPVAMDRAGSGVAVPSELAPFADGAQDRRQFAMSPRPTDIDEARAIAHERILGPILKDHKAPLSDDAEVLREWEDDIKRYAERRHDDIEALARNILRGPRESVCCACDEPATTVIAGSQYCSVHARSAQRPPAPEHLRLVS
jgi:hypothetical protein